MSRRSICIVILILVGVFATRIAVVPVRVAAEQVFFSAVGQVIQPQSPSRTSDANVVDENTLSTKSLALVKDINPGQLCSCPSYLTAMGDMLYFNADEGGQQQGYRLWKSDGTRDGTTLVILLPGASAFASSMIAIDHTLYFAVARNAGTSAPFITELWKSDGTTLGTQLITSFVRRIPTNLQFTRVGDDLFFSTDDTNDHYQLWKSDGTPEGTQLIKDGLPYALGQLTLVGKTLFFVAGSENNEYGLWRSDGTTLGTVFVKKVLIEQYPMAVVGTTLFFVANEPETGRELWKSDGTTDGTVLVKDIRPGNEGAFFPLPFSPKPSLTDGIHQLFFVASDGIHGHELWKSDGTDAGTVMVRDINVMPDGSTPYNLTPTGGVVYFIANDRMTGNELWKSDGTMTGTVLVRDIVSGPASTFPRVTDAIPATPMRTDYGMVLFSARYNGTTTKLWYSDGTASQTQPVPDETAAQTIGVAEQLTISGRRLFFLAANEDTNYELWSLELPTLTLLPHVQH